MTADALTPEELSAMTFEELVEQLERVTRQMASGDIGIEAVADLYEQAGVLHVEAAARLDRVRERIAKLAEPGEEPREPIGQA